jgi:putative ABC transport system substrate-binding protein
MRRRDVITALGGAAVHWPLGARAQASRMPRVGILASGRAEGADASRVMIDAIIEGLRDLGYSEGQTIIFERRYGDSSATRLRDAAAELVERQVDVIVAQSTTAARPARQATAVIPIVAIGMADPVEDELVASLARPGGNVTGTTFLGPELVAKRLQLLKEAVPQLTEVAVLWHPRAYSDRTTAGMLKVIESAADSVAVRLQLVPAAGPGEIADAFAAIIGGRATAITVFPSPMLFAEYPRIARLAADHRLPAIYAAREGAVLGGMMSYGANLPDLSRQTAAYVHKILKGARPADLPVQQPVKFELVINLAAARTLGIDISPALLGRADEVIE